MAGYASFGHGIHFAGADLYFYRQTVRAGKGCMQALVTVAFGDGDIVFDFAGFGLVEIVQCAQCGVTGGNAVDDNTEAVNIHHFGKTQVFGLHFLINAVQVFFAAFDLCFDIGADQALAEGAQDFADHVAAVAAERIHRFLQRVVAAGVDVLE